MLITRLAPLSHRLAVSNDSVRRAVVAVTVELLSRVPKVRYTAVARERPAKFLSGCKHRVISFRETFALS